MSSQEDFDASPRVLTSNRVGIQPYLFEPLAKAAKPTSEDDDLIDLQSSPSSELTSDSNDQRQDTMGGLMSTAGGKDNGQASPRPGFTTSADFKPEW
jgi:hypothetical protein